MKKWITAVVIILLGWNIVLSVELNVLKKTENQDSLESIETDDNQTIIRTTLNGYTTDITETVKKCTSSLVKVEGTSRQYNGVIYSTSTKTTYIITTDSIVEEDAIYTIHFANDERVEAELAGFDSLTGVALFSCSPSFTCSALEHGDSSILQAGEYVIAIGAKETDTQSAPLSFGIVQGPVQQWTENEESEWISSLMVSDIMARESLEGGALVNLSGQLVGLIQSPYEETLTAVSNEEISQVVKLLQQNGQVTRGYLGVIGKNVEDLQLYQKSAMSLTLDNNSGVVVVKIQEESPAALAGLQTSDVIVGVDDVTVAAISDLRNVLYSHIAGDIVSVTYLRNGNQYETEVTLQ